MVFLPNVHEADRGFAPVAAKSRDYPLGYVSPLHEHPTAQLVYAVEGVMLVMTTSGQWVVPPTRGIWLPIGTQHVVRMVTAVRMRTLYVRQDTLAGLPEHCCVLAITPLLRELILAAMSVVQPYVADSREGRIMQLLLDEVQMQPALPLVLPSPYSADLCQLCDHLREFPGDNTKVEQWAQKLGMDPRTLQRRFVRETGLTFARWRRQARLLLALLELAQGRRILDIALDLGYDSPTAFATMFRRELGQSPSAFFTNVSLSAPAEL